MGIKSDSYGNLLIPIMFSKLPEELRLFISRKFDQDTWDINKLLKEFMAELDARKRVSLLNPRPENTFQANGQSSAGGVRPKIPTAGALLSPQENRSKPSPTCSFCQKNHASSSCNIVTDVAARKQILGAQGRA